MGGRNRTVSIVFYAALVIVLVGIWTKTWAAILPDGIATRIGHNSEGLLMALILAAWIQFARPALKASRREVLITTIVSVGCVVVAILLLLSDLPSQWRTLNETFLAAAVVLAYVQISRPLPRAVPWIVLGALLMVIVVFNRTGPVTDYAETLAIVVLAVVAFDLVDRPILDAAAVSSLLVRSLWYAALVILPIAFSMLEYRVGVEGLGGEAVRYLVRVAEAFLCLLIVELYFTLGLVDHGRKARSEVVAEARV